MSTCDITDDNNLDMVHDVMVGTCQDMCSGNPECNWFTWYNVDGLKGTCWFLDHCSSQEPCSECVSGEHVVSKNRILVLFSLLSGPAEGPDVNDCI